MPAGPELPRSNLEHPFGDDNGEDVCSAHLRKALPHGRRELSGALLEYNLKGATKTFGTRTLVHAIGLWRGSLHIRKSIAPLLAHLAHKDGAIYSG
jgi:hypothetical protein